MGLGCHLNDRNPGDHVSDLSDLNELTANRSNTRPMKRSLLAAAALLTAIPALAGSLNFLGIDGHVSFFSLIVIACYFFPSIIGAFRKHHNLLAIFLLNLFLGWSGLGWIGALVWAATTLPRPMAYNYVPDRRDDDF
jgi:hypothetical protein